MENISRRNFVGAMGMMGAIGAMSAAGAVALADETATEEVAEPEAEAAPAADTEFVPGGGSFAEGMLDLGWTGTPVEIAALGGSTMPLAELNRRRQAYLDAQTDYTCEDGTVIPAVYVKMRALIHSYGMGCGNTPTDTCFDDMMAKFTEDQAQAFLDMPMGEKFTAIDLYEKTGRPLEECKELCEHAADCGYLCRFENNSGVVYHQVPYFQGVVEYHFTDAIAEPGYNVGTQGADMLGVDSDMRTTGTPTFYAMPCDKSVVADEEGVLPFDDYEAIIASHGKFAIAPCYCRYTALVQSGAEDVPTFEDFATGELEDYFSPACDRRVETCLMMGDEADYWIHMGWGREVSAEDAVRYMKRSCDDGFILESCFTKDTGTICSCSVAGQCGILMEWSTLGSAEAVGSSQPFTQISHYNLEVDLDACIKCGTCATRCPLETIVMDEETGYPTVGPNCFRCGQCAYVCPQGARKLVARPAEENLELPRDFLADGNMKAAYRFEHGLIS